MNRKTVWTLSAALVLALAFAGAIVAGEQEGEPDMAAMMAEWAKYAEPGDHHQHLQKLAGKWEAHAKFFMGPEPMESHGTQVIKPILGGRFIQTDFSGEFMGNAFAGMALDGYDIYNKKHVGLWIDTMGTMMMTFEGKCEDGGRVTKMKAHYNDPMTGSESWMKGVTTIVDDNTFTYEGWEPGPDGKAIRTMEITYKRKS